ncbi:MAG: hypothetical protein QXG03_09165 [Halalkalicoccus sp.]
MLKPLLAIVALVELLAPDRFIGFWERVALSNPEECSRKAWVNPVARLEGAFVLLALARPQAFSGIVRSALGWYGLLAALAPEGYLAYWTPLVYDGRPEWAWWVAPLTRAVGVCYVLFALFWRPSKETNERE